ncbi:hypothetical protein BDV33DRAFT_197437 [Aspergillus novoparasiticus]|uniref:Uncharacterized protein n=1 Tax=Aspergillus novoparasiticus TaxID=986946 RepID=A0A5N6F993_9EURO|nr:hypothetical protein BDV33DRAFT_197437 [Aspergillus novoparasiticus]
MSFLSSGYWMMRHASPEQSDDHAGSEDDQTSQSQIDTRRRRLTGLYYENQYLKSRARELYQRHLADSEKIRRLHDLVSQGREDASKADKLHHEELNKLYNKINSLQMRRENLDDEQVLDKMRSLNQNLELWIKSNFKDVKRLAGLGQPDVQFPRGSPQCRAWIQGCVTEMIYNSIFSPYYFGLPDNPWGQVVEFIKAGVGKTHPEGTCHDWREVTCDAIEQITKDDQEALLTYIITSIEEQFSTFSSTEETQRKRQLRELLQKCSNFKTVLSRQQNLFHFYRSKCGECFSTTSMTFAGGVDGPATKVRISLWPGLIKQNSMAASSVFEAELVWTIN